MIQAYLKYILRAKNRHGVHSPFVYRLNDKVFAKKMYYAYDELAQMRRKLATNKERISVTDLGAGSKRLSNERRISKILNTSVMRQKYQQLLFQLVQDKKPSTILELGTSIGLTTAYLAKAVEKGNVISIEGCPNTAAVAAQTLQDLNIKNVAIEIGPFDEHLERILTEHQPEFVLIDGNHTEEATLRYFELLKSHATPNTVLIFDDIHWSSGMERAWEQIKKDPEVRVSIDVFQLGLTFFNPSLSKEDYVIRY